MSGKLLYFIYNRYTGLIKIGVTRSLENRLKDLECAAGVRLDVMGTLEQSSDMEIPLHTALFQTRECGEWFRPSEDLVAIAKAPAREAIQALLEKYAPTVRERERELAVIDEARQAARTEQKRLITEERKRLEAIKREKERKAAERRAKKKVKQDTEDHQRMQEFRAGSAAALEKMGLVVKAPIAPLPEEKERQRERNEQFIGLRGGIS